MAGNVARNLLRQVAREIGFGRARLACKVVRSPRTLLLLPTGAARHSPVHGGDIVPGGLTQLGGQTLQLEHVHGCH
jgi:hypothetical protein